jgi:HEAT repeat protein
MGLLSELGPLADAAVPAVCSVLVTPPTISVPPGGATRFVKLPNRVVPGVLTAVYVSTEHLRYQAAHTLAVIGPDRPESLLAILEVAKNPNARFHFGSVPKQADWTVATRKALPELVRATSSPTENVRSIALGLLGRYGLNERSAILALSRASNTEAGPIANNAAAHLGDTTNHLDIAVGALVTSLGATNVGNSVGTPLDGGQKSPNHFHGEAARALVRLHARTPLVKPALLEALAHPESGVRAGAAHVVGALGTDLAEAEQRLRELHSVETNTPVRFHQAYAVLRLSKDARLFMPHILASLTAPSETSRWGALGLLQLHGRGHEDVVPRLMELAEKETAERVRAQMVTVLGMLGRQAEPALPMLQRMLADEHVFVRDAATNAIVKIRQSLAAK